MEALWAWPASAGPTNDDFSNRIVLSGTNVSSSVVITGATHEPGEPNPYHASPGASVWWEWTSPYSGGVAVTGSASLWSPTVAVFTGDALSNLTLVAGNVYGGAGGTKASFRAQAGERYQIVLDSAGNPTGQIILSLRPGPANDDFASRKQLTGARGGTTAILNGATREPGEPVHSAQGRGASVWWVWTAPATQGMAFDAASTSVAIAIYTGDSLTNLARVPTVSSTDDYSITRVTFRADAGQTYCVVVENVAPDLPTFTLSWFPGPANDDFAARLPVTGSNVTVTAAIAGATHEPGEPNPNKTSPGASVWWEWTAPFSGGVALSSTGYANPTPVAAFTGTALSNLALVTPIGAYPPMAFRAQAGQKYQVVADAHGLAMGTVTVTLRPGPANDDFALRAQLAGTNGTGSSTLNGATLEPGEPVTPSGAAFGSVWWEWTAPGDGGVGMEANAPDAAIVLAVYAGETLTSLVPVASGQGGWGSPARVSFRAQGGMRYAIAVSGLNGYGGSVSLNVKGGPTNDAFANRLPLGGGPVAVASTTLGATSEPGESALGLGIPLGTLWYDWLVPTSGGWELRIAAGALAVSAAAYSGDTLSNLTLRAMANAARQATGSHPFRADSGERLAVAVNVLADGGGPFRLWLLPGPTNDDFENAITIANFGTVYRADTTGATRQAGEPQHNGAAQGRSVWWVWTAPTTGGCAFESSGNAAAPFAGIYQGDALTNLSAVPAVRQPLANGTRTAFHAVAGQRYSIVLDDQSASGQPVSFLMYPGPSNDDFANATPITALNQPITGTTDGATTEPGEPRVLNGARTTVWYVWTAPTQGAYVARLNSTLAPTVLAVCQGADLTDLTALAVGEPAIDQIESLAGFHTRGGDHFFMVVDSSALAPGWFSLRVSPAAANDDFAARAELLGVPVTNTVPEFLASSEPGEPTHGDLTNAPSLWWKWTAPTTGGYQISMLPRFGTGALAVYTGQSLADLVPAAAPAEGTSGALSIILHATAGSEYEIAVAQRSGGASPVTLAIARTPANDDFADRQVFQGTAVTQTFAFPGATFEPSEPIIPGTEGFGSLWWEWTAPTSHSFLVTAKVPGIQGLAIAAFTGTKLEDLNMLSYAISTLGAAPQLALRATAGITYYLAVASPPLDEYRNITLSLAPGPANDDFANRLPLTGSGMVVAGTTLGATREAGEPSHGGRDNGASVWYTWTAPIAGQFIASARPVASSASPSLGLFTGDALGTLTALGSKKLIGRVSFEAVPGTTYQIAIDSPTNEMTDFNLVLGPKPPNDDFADRIFLSGAHATGRGANLNATSAFPESTSGNANSIWWAWIAPADGLARARVTLTESNLSPGLDFYVELPGVMLTNAARSASGVGSNLVSRTFAVTAGKVYDFRVTSSPGDSTNITFSLDLEPQPAFDGTWAKAGQDWVRGGEALWFLQTNIVHDPPVALQVNLMTDTTAGIRPGFWPGFSDPPAAWIEATFPGPGTLQFWWKVGSNILAGLSCDVVTHLGQISIMGSPPLNWELKTVALPDRTNVVRWTFVSGGGKVGAPNSAWLDSLALAPTPPPPFRLTYPRPSTNGLWSLGFQGQAQRIYHVEASTNLEQWIEITNVFCQANSSLRILFPVDTNSIMLFLRATAE